MVCGCLLLAVPQTSPLSSGRSLSSVPFCFPTLHPSSDTLRRDLALTYEVPLVNNTERAEPRQGAGVRNNSREKNDRRATKHYTETLFSYLALPFMRFRALSSVSSSFLASRVRPDESVQEEFLSRS
jgi:hypothetical protein